MTIPIGSDHAGFETKEEIKKLLKSFGYECDDKGTFSAESVDYPDFAVKVAESVGNGTYQKGILVCGSGQGVCITANKVRGVRAALGFNEESAALTRQHNNANILCLPGRMLPIEELKKITIAWLNAEFEGGRHERRVKKIHSLTEEK
jgi:ribose 5-phosphate isomerase B